MIQNRDAKVTILRVCDYADRKYLCAESGHIKSFRWGWASHTRIFI